MTSDEMIVEFRSRLDESTGYDRLVELQQKYEMLNASILFLANNLDADRHLQSLVSSGGAITLPKEVNPIVLPSDYLKFHDVYESGVTAQRYNTAQMVNHRDSVIYRNPYNVPPTDMLTCAFDGKETLFVFNETRPVEITWRYIVLPATITSAVNTDLSDRYHGLVVDYAEYLGWIQLDDTARANAVLQSVMAQIVRLNPKQEEIKS